MPATSERQRRFMGLALALERGDADPNKVGERVRRAASSMSEKQLRDYASAPKRSMMNTRHA